jgi:NAD(P)-dependent dehydrogenase (short-subunit alcohol dehydrogenase family)
VKVVFDMAEQEWDAVIAVHLKGTFNTTKFAAIHWRDHRAGHYRLINFTSRSGLFGGPGQPNYAAVKMGIVGFTFSCANALARYGATANTIAPGAATRMVFGIPEAQRSREALREEMTPENVVPALLYLASTRSDWITGRVIAARGHEIALYSHPEEICTIRTDGKWDLDDMFGRFEREFRPVIDASPPNLFGATRGFSPGTQ